MGVKGAAFRLGWEAMNRSGLRAIREPIGSAPIPDTDESHEQWFGRLNEQHPLRLVRRLIGSGEARATMHALLSESERQSAIARADGVQDGKIELFRAFTVVPGTPPNWHLEPRRRRSWPAAQHWSTLLSHEDRNGDIKLTWELNRFIHAYDLIRGYALDASPKRCRTFVHHLRDWEESNPFRAGVNWASGQELAVRVLSWSYAVAAFGEDAEFSEDDFQRYRRLSYAHAIHIAQHIDFAEQSVSNNHLLSEALGLFVIGSSFDFDESREWVQRSEAILDELLDQFDPDGGYCQNSFSYARFALQLWLEVIRWRPEMRYRALPVLRRAALQVLAFMSEEGRLPNWGNNDGSTLNVWNGADYQDYRPIVAAVLSACGEPTDFGAPACENLMWLFGVCPTFDGDMRLRPRQDFPATGIYSRRSESARAFVRAGPMHCRTGHADQLHVDVWFGDREVACDAGSYSYHVDPEFHRWATGPQSHNTVTVDGIEPMRLTRKFRWGGFGAGRVVWSDEFAMQLTWPRLEEFGVRWLRRVSVEKGEVIVRDTVDCLDGQARTVRLHWLLAGVDWNQRGNSFGSDGVQLELEISDDAALSTHVGRDGVLEGWHSRYYGLREPCTSVVSSTSTTSATFVSRFSIGCQAPS